MYLYIFIFKEGNIGVGLMFWFGYKSIRNFRVIIFFKNLRVDINLKL